MTSCDGHSPIIRERRGEASTRVSPRRLVAKLHLTFAPLLNVICSPTMTAEQYFRHEKMVIPGPKRKKGMPRPE